MAGIGGQILGELGELGKQVGTEVVKAPTDIVGSALESLGGTSGKKQQSGAATVATPGSEKPVSTGPWQEIDTLKDKHAKEAIARAALAQIAGNKPKAKELSVWERMQKEDQEKKELAKKQGPPMPKIASPTSAKGKGDLFGVKAKQAQAEKKSIRQD